LNAPPDPYVGEGHKEAKKRVAMEEKCGVAKVLGISKLRANYKPYEAKRKLCASYDLFVADERVLGVLPKMLGKTFFQKKRHPLPVDLTKKDWAAQIRRAADATYLYLNGGSSLNVRVGLTSFEADAVVENVMAAAEGAAKVIPGGWDAFQAMFLKTTESVALPLFSLARQPDKEAAAAEPEEGGKKGGETKKGSEEAAAGGNRGKKLKEGTKEGKATEPAEEAPKPVKKAAKATPKEPKETKPAKAAAAGTKKRVAPSQPAAAAAGKKLKKR